METLDRDKEYLIKNHGIPVEEGDMDKKANVREGEPTSTLAKEWFKNVTRTQVMELYKWYQPDFELFGYDIEPYYSLAKIDKKS